MKRVSDSWVCSASHGQRSRSIRTRSTNAHDLAGDRRGQLRHPQRSEVVGLDDAVEVVPRHRRDRLVGQTEPLQHDRRSGPSSSDELDLGQHVRASRTGHQQSGRARPRPRSRSDGRRRAARPRRTDRRRARAQREVEERQRRMHRPARCRRAPQQLDGALGDERRTGNDVEHLPSAHARLRRPVRRWRRTPRRSRRPTRTGRRSVVTPAASAPNAG